MSTRVPAWPSRSALWGTLLGALLSACQWGCTTQYRVERRHGDVISEGRYIPPLAYAYYARAVHHETHGEWEHAEAAYAETLSRDPQSGAAWAGLVRLACRRSLTEAQTSHDRAVRAADRPALIHLALGRCALNQSKVSAHPNEAMEHAHAAELAAQAAVNEEPQSPEASQLLIDTLAAQGKQQQAKRAARAFALSYPHRLPRPQQSSPPSSVWLSAVDEALMAGDLSAARSSAASHLSAGSLAVRAELWGLHELATQQATWVLAANPHDADAQILLLTRSLHEGTETAPESVDVLMEHAAEASPYAQLLVALALQTYAPDVAAQFVQQSQLHAALQGDTAVTFLLDYLSNGSAESTEPR